ncbi:GNAT family N-acetyltransferase [Alicyclobacillus dauci]|uniref:GNAT family N-acetyltransferase n=1 Tax=Alicyclobacillus dauci TaxID=1475485 RepID=A0ABY6Z4M4_9BACL|nr:GNAT family N-acetyltransferase [Alicyclobacillus dauci]WAH37266.1 GNAT family N-acetyltransferase [Alicyclobacillus dauci]
MFDRVLEGTWVRLEPMTEEHVDGLYEAAQSSDIWAYMPRTITTRADMVSLVKDALSAYAAGEEVPFVVTDKATDTIVGSTRFLDISERNRQLEIGWTWLNPRVWRTPVNTECKYLLLKVCFEDLKLLRVQIKTDARNVRSQRAIERIGGVREGVLRKHRILHDGYVRDSVYYSILDDEWPQVKERLERLMNRQPVTE